MGKSKTLLEQSAERLFDICTYGALDKCSFDLDKTRVLSIVASLSWAFTPIFKQELQSIQTLKKLEFLLLAELS